MLWIKTIEQKTSEGWQSRPSDVDEWNVMSSDAPRQAHGSTLSVASMAGAFFGFSLVIGAVVMGTSHYHSFFNIEAFMIVVGGTFAVSFMSFEASTVITALKSIGSMFVNAQITHENLRNDLSDILAWAQIVKEKGLRGLEAEMYENITDPFVKYGLNMVVSNYTPDEVRTIMETTAESSYERDTAPARVLMTMAGHAPAFGMVGTLIGMVVLLGSIGSDMSLVASALAACLLATLYGVVTARLIYIPAATKFIQKQEVLRFRNHLIAEGMAMLVANKSPHYIQDRLTSFLALE